MTIGRKIRALNTMHSSGLWLIRTDLGCELKALDDMNNWELWIILTTRDLMSLGL